MNTSPRAAAGVLRQVRERKCGRLFCAGAAPWHARPSSPLSAPHRAFPPSPPSNQAARTASGSVRAASSIASADKVSFRCFSLARHPMQRRPSGALSLVSRAAFARRRPRVTPLGRQRGPAWSRRLLPRASRALRPARAPVHRAAALRSQPFFLRGAALTAAPLSFPPQAPMSRLEPTEFINDRYAKMEENLAVRFVGQLGEPFFLCVSAFGAPANRPRSPSSPPPQIVRRRLNRPLTLAEKVRVEWGWQGVRSAAAAAARRQPYPPGALAACFSSFCFVVAAVGSRRAFSFPALARCCTHVHCGHTKPGWRRHTTRGSRGAAGAQFP